jgi:phosphoenolpyruvate carboxylase
MDISQDIHLLGDLLGQVISELESPAIFATEERIRAEAKSRRAGDPEAAERLRRAVAALQADEARAVAASFATYFDLVNLAEDNYRLGLLRQEELEREDRPVQESVAEAIALLKARGVTPEQMRTLLENLSIELVLTAHPTESRRRTIISKLQRLASLLRESKQPHNLPRERKAALKAIHAEITTLWLSDRNRTSKLAVTDEVRTGLYYIDSVFWQTIPQLYADLDQALDEHYPGLRVEHPWLRLASWMGGDRDGNPNVTSEVTAETLRLHRGLAVENHRRALQSVARHLSLSARRLPIPSELADWLEDRRPLPPHVEYIARRYASEPYRLILSLLAADLAEASQDDMKSRLLGREPHQARIVPAEIRTPIDLIAQAIPPALADDELRTFRRQLAVFGLHAARLDIREDSSKLNAALGEILRALEITPAFEALPAAERFDLLTRLLSSPLPALSTHPGVTAAAAETWALFQLIARVQQVYGADLLGPVVISMTHSAADVLTVLLLARWTGCDTRLSICPLFESVEDLEAAPHILAEMFTSKIYRAHLEICQKEQMVMIGYSDSNKDGGYLMANWALYQAQETITQAAQEHDIRLTIFHGRGGTVARGGGPANRAIRAQPAGSIHGRFRLTEQGEIIASRYSNPDLAHRHLEQIVHAVLLASAPADCLEGGEFCVPLEWRLAMDKMSASAYRAYRELVYETPRFIEFWQAATPLDEIKRLQIGSRPVSRAGTTEVANIRAIPWVFSWMQSRYNLPGWYGLGTGLSAMAGVGEQVGAQYIAPQRDPLLTPLREMYTGWPFFKTLLDNAELSLLKADMGIAALYAELVPDRELGERLFATILAEYNLTRELVLAISGHQALLESEPVTMTAVRLRNPYIDPSNYIQVEMLRRLRSLPENSPETEILREAVVLTINGIAAGLKNTG